MKTATKLKEHRKSGQQVRMRNPELRDGAVFWRLAKDSGSLDLNSPYAYLMWCDQFADTSLIAEVEGSPAAFLMGFSPPGRDEVLFVWQVAVADEHRGLGLASRMLDELLERVPALQAVEATATPSNVASQRLFQSLAMRHGCPCSQSDYLSAEHFPASGHEPETLFHIGPIETAK